MDSSSSSVQVLNMELYHTAIYKKIGKNIIDIINEFLGFLEAEDWNKPSDKRCAYCLCPRPKYFCDSKLFKCEENYWNQVIEAEVIGMANKSILESVAMEFGIKFPPIDPKSFKSESLHYLYKVDSRLRNYLYGFDLNIFGKISSAAVQLVIYIVCQLDYRYTASNVFIELLSMLQTTRYLQLKKLPQSIEVVRSDRIFGRSIFGTPYDHIQPMCTLIERLKMDYYCP